MLHSQLAFGLGIEKFVVIAWCGLVIKPGYPVPFIFEHGYQACIGGKSTYCRYTVCATSARERGKLKKQNLNNKLIERAT